MSSSRENFFDFIRQVIPVPDEVIHSIIKPFEEISISRNDFFLRAGTYTDQYLYLNKGFIRAYSHNQEGDEVTTAFYSGPSMVFEVYSFFSRKISQENIQALTECEGLVISYNQLNHLFHSLPAFRDFGRAILVKGFSQLKQRMLSQITETAEERYNRLLQSNPEVFMHAPLKDIASYLGITDSSLSRIRRHFGQK
ncbi:MAG TPA: Crp/Fnr family transcriptional regulator [Chitinophagaceae bacterium]|nr:Crp/Fnr family transcriptional regulator [Chitinophagaceae bacterium]